MKRRDLLTASLAAPLAAVPAVAVVEMETPVMRAYRAWLDLRAWGIANSAMTDAEVEVWCDDMADMANSAVAMKSEGYMDTIVKFLLVVEDYQFFANIPELEPLEAEVRAIVWGRA
ncbi:hypothetical protein [Paenirhodobacter populi]|uniref:Twin-arginine translocation signal domain-containing protein n=1 Tax=Paenirhodobacter populi TaxID=2306993 RepID=A0A443IQR2_9RHOB|nr:hypothetical protein [Sinirhodobacter populi]RWR08494.1 hypothetical protein D2T33_15475 [Sinirhodobacter populi]